MSKVNGNGNPEGGALGDKLLPQEIAITRIVHERLQKEECLLAGDRESVAYRIAEIMVAAKELYTESLPRLVEPKEGESSAIFEELTGLRMAFLHVRDLVTDFDEAFMEAMHHQRQHDEEEADEQE